MLLLFQHFITLSSCPTVLVVQWLAYTYNFEDKEFTLNLIQGVYQYQILKNIYKLLKMSYPQNLVPNTVSDAESPPIALNNHCQGESMAAANIVSSDSPHSIINNQDKPAPSENVGVFQSTTIQAPALEAQLLPGDNSGSIPHEMLDVQISSIHQIPHSSTQEKDVIEEMPVNGMEIIPEIPPTSNQLVRSQQKTPPLAPQMTQLGGQKAQLNCNIGINPTQGANLQAYTPSLEGVNNGMDCNLVPNPEVEGERCSVDVINEMMQEYQTPQFRNGAIAEPAQSLVQQIGQHGAQQLNHQSQPIKLDLEQPNDRQQNQEQLNCQHVTGTNANQQQNQANNPIEECINQHFEEQPIINPSQVQNKQAAQNQPSLQLPVQELPTNNNPTQVLEQNQVLQALPQPTSRMDQEKPEDSCVINSEQGQANNKAAQGGQKPICLQQQPEQGSKTVSQSKQRQNPQQELICFATESPELTDINEIRTLLLKYLPANLKELTLTLADEQLREMYLQIRAEEESKMAAHNLEMARKLGKPNARDEEQPRIDSADNCLGEGVHENGVHSKSLNEQMKNVSCSKPDGFEIESHKAGKRARKRIVTTVVQQVEYVEESDGESPRKCVILEDGSVRRKQNGKTQMQTILSQICSLVRSLDLSNVNENGA